jgi:hypothetical protein
MKDTTILRKAANIVKSRCTSSEMKGVAAHLEELAFIIETLDRLKKKTSKLKTFIP